MFQWQHLAPRVRGTTYFSILQCDSYLSVVFVLFLTWFQTLKLKTWHFFLGLLKVLMGGRKKKVFCFHMHDTVYETDSICGFFTTKVWC